MRVGLLEPALDRERRRAVDGADVVQAEEPALEDVVAGGVLPVDPPGEVQEQLLEDALEEDEVGGAVDGEDPQRGPRVDGRVHVAEGPLVGRQLAVGVHVPLAAHQQELVLGELRIEVGDGDALEGQVPRREPRVLPGVADRQHVGGVEVAPLVVAASVATLGRRRTGGVAVEPLLDVVVEPLLGPHHPGQGLADDHRGLVVEVAEQPGVEGVGLRFALVATSP